MDLKINPFNKGNPMTLMDAAKVSAISATAIYFLTFFINITAGQISADPVTFLVDSVKTWMASFWGNFIALAGLEQLIKPKEETKQ